MSQYVIIKKIQVQNANAVAGLTWGFPAITHFLGFAHALSRKISTAMNPSLEGLSLGGVGVVCHHYKIQARQPKGWGDYVFALTRNPLTKEGKTAPIIEEGRMNMDVSLVIELEGLIAGDALRAKELCEWLALQLPKMRLAGGQIINQPKVAVESLMGNEVSKHMRRLLPGFALVDRNDYLQTHFKELKKNNNEATLLDAWLDFAALKYQAQALSDSEQEEASTDSAADSSIKAQWHYQKKPAPGYLVPLAVGYCAISNVYEPGAVENVRDNTFPAVFAETAHSVGEWLSPHRIHDMPSFIWRYHHNTPWYVAKAQPLNDTEFDDSDFTENRVNYGE